MPRRCGFAKNRPLRRALGNLTLGTDVEPHQSVFSRRAMGPIKVRGILISAVLLSVSAVPARAQLTVVQSSGCPAPVLARAEPLERADTSAARVGTTGADSAGRTASSTGRADVVLLVAFSADELRFNSQPDARIRFCWGGDSLHVVERKNLPSPVVAGTTYRNVFIAAELRAYLNAECLSERLGFSGSTAQSQPDSLCAVLGLTTSGAAARPTVIGTRISRPAQPPKTLRTTSVSGSSR